MVRHAVGAPASQGGRFRPADTPAAAVALVDCDEGCGRPADSDENPGMCQECVDDVICRDCGGRNDNGEGWDGLCGNCADVFDQQHRCPRCDDECDDLGVDGFCPSCAAEVG